ncbi:MAG TPA: preprotein translocase subunit YajC [Victivallales bacterium]|nr:preprotein translocase subunit YajC [Victivallales bacterium]HPO91327.1 preprotein translocase subunit YajC [Victivallales bacterium]HRR06655.1 preprotein translocase subunit YajC [Victivallales bacterium]HRR28222.1 preprotein translocase subunit YajC [Victivallales bacterium]HRU00706.1 preprotein translocase subunit YajC [Victivallales bacterium]
MINSILMSLGQTSTNSIKDLFASPLVPMLVFMLFMIFIMYRSQQKEQKKKQELLKNLKSGDKVVTTSGIHGIISNVKEKTFILKIADNVKIEINKANIAGLEDSKEKNSEG